jgi:hypothetical protein
MYVPPAHNCTAGLARPPASRHPQRRRSELASVLKQTIEEDCLPLQNLRTGLVEPKLGRAVKFRKFLTPPGSWRPFHLEHIALQSAGVPVTFNGPYVNGLSTRLLCLAKRPRFSARAITRLFRELPICSGERVSLSVIRPFGIAATSSRPLAGNGRSCEPRSDPCSPESAPEHLMK